MHRCGPQGAAALIRPPFLCYRRRCCRASSTRSSRSPYGELGRRLSMLSQAQFVEPLRNLLPQFPSATVALGRPAMVQECTFSAPGFAFSPNISVNHLLPSLVFQATAKPLRHHHSRLWPAPKPLHPGVRDEVPRPVRVLRAAVLVGQSHRRTARTKGPPGERLLTLWGARPRAGRVGTRTPRSPQDSLPPQIRLPYFIL